MSDLEDVSRVVSVYETRSIDGAIDRQYPLVTETRCVVCMHPQRIWIENAYFEGFRPTAIINRLEDPTSVQPYNITRHFRNNHVPPHKEIVQQALWARAEADGVTPEEYEAGQQRHIMALDLVVDKFRHKLNDPDFTPDMKDGLSAIKLFHDIQISAERTGLDPNDMFVALSMFMMHVRTILSRYLPEDAEVALNDLNKLLNSDPVLRGLSEKTQAIAPATLEDEEDDSEEAEVIPTTLALSDGEFDEPDDE